jgi:hypothetical protein
MHDPLWDAFVVEVEDLLAEMEVVDQQRPACADALVISDGTALRRRQNGRFALGNLVQLAAIATRHLLIVDLRRGRRGFRGFR